MIKKIGLEDIMPLATDTDRQQSDSGFVVLSNVQPEDFVSNHIQATFLTVVYCTQGSGTLKVDEQPLELGVGDMLLLFHDRELRDICPSADMQCLVVAVSQELFGESYVGMQHLWPYLLYILAHPVIHISKEEEQRILGLADMIKLRREASDYPYRQEVTLALMRIFYYDLCFLLQRRQAIPSRNSHRHYVMFDQFLRLLKEHCHSHREVVWYANRLCVTPKYLSDVVRSVSGMPAGRWISGFVLIEIKRYLRNTSLSVKEIAQELNFSTIGFLGKYFRQHTGLSPSQYRNKF